MSKEHMPDFLVIGAGKSGTSALNRFLKSHPALFLPVRKEPNFFAYESIDPDNMPADVAEAHFRTSVYELGKYQELFANAPEGKLKGEISNTYLYNHRAAPAIHRYLPGVKLIAILRQPAERLFSRYQHLVREGHAPKEGLGKVFERNSIWWQRPDFIMEGMYYRNLKPYYDLFPHENIRVYLYDDYIRNTQGVLKDIFKFLGVDTEVKIDTDVRVNVSGVRKPNLWNYLIGSNGLVVKTMKKNAPGLVKKIRKSHYTTKKLNEIRNKNIERQEISPQLRTRISNEIYGEDIHLLENLIGRKLTHWY